MRKLTKQQLIVIILLSLLSGFGLLILSTIISLFFWQAIHPLYPPCGDCVYGIQYPSIGLPLIFMDDGTSYINLLLDIGFYFLISFAFFSYIIRKRPKKK